MKGMRKKLDIIIHLIIKGMERNELGQKIVHWQLYGSLAQEEKCKELTPQTILKKEQ